MNGYSLIGKTLICEIKVVDSNSTILNFNFFLAFLGSSVSRVLVWKTKGQWCNSISIQADFLGFYKFFIYILRNIFKMKKNYFFYFFLKKNLIYISIIFYIYIFIIIKFFYLFFIKLLITFINFKNYLIFFYKKIKTKKKKTLNEVII